VHIWNARFCAFGSTPWLTDQQDGLSGTRSFMRQKGYRLPADDGLLRGGEHRVGR
jgi:hypothetical protein